MAEQAPYEDEFDPEVIDDADVADPEYGSRDAILFCIDASRQMQSPDMPVEQVNAEGEVVTTYQCILQSCLETILEIYKRKLAVAPTDYLGIMLYNTEQRLGQLHYHTQDFFPLSQVDVPAARKLSDYVVQAARAPETFIQTSEQRASLTPQGLTIDNVLHSAGHIFSTLNRRLGSKRIFLITIDDRPPGKVEIARTKIDDLDQNDITVEPFFLGKHFDSSKYWQQLFPVDDKIEFDKPRMNGFEKFDELSRQLQIRQTPKRSAFHMPFELGGDLTIGIRAFNMIMESKMPTATYAANDSAITNGQDGYEETYSGGFSLVGVRELYYDSMTSQEVSRDDLVSAFSLGGGEGPRSRVIFSPEDIKSFKTFGYPLGFKLLGFRDADKLKFNHQWRTAMFLYPSERDFVGSTRVFSALLQSCLKKDKHILVRSLVRQRGGPVLGLMVPQAEVVEDGMQVKPPGFNLIFMPFADDIRELPGLSSVQADETTKDMAISILNQITIQRPYDPDSYPNPALGIHNAQIQALAFDEAFNVDDFAGFSAPDITSIRERAGSRIDEFLERTRNTGEVTELTVKRKEVSEDDSAADALIYSYYRRDALKKLQLPKLKAFLEKSGFQESLYKIRKDDAVAEIKRILDKDPAAQASSAPRQKTDNNADTESE